MSYGEIVSKKAELEAERDLFKRRWGHSEELRNGLAAEIERLKALCDGWADKWEREQGENERLRQSRQLMQLDAEKYRAEAQELKAEVERLRDQIKCMKERRSASHSRSWHIC